MAEFFENIIRVFSDGFYLTFVKDDRYVNLISGLSVSLQITAIASIIGVVLGIFVAILRLQNKGLLGSLASGYITLIRGTPAVVQLTIIYFVILVNTGLPDIVVGSIAFGLNSGAYVAEIIRAGIMAVDKGQMEAGRSLGLSYSKTMVSIIIPQAIKNVLPALGNEFIVLLKETSIAGYVGFVDLNKAGQRLGNITYNMYYSSLSVAYIYLLMTTTLAGGINRLERRLHRSD